VAAVYHALKGLGCSVEENDVELELGCRTGEDPGMPTVRRRAALVAALSRIEQRPAETDELRRAPALHPVPAPRYRPTPQEGASWTSSSNWC
jgi:hypothetical protein